MLTRKADLTEGKISPAIFRFCIPIIIGSLVQTMFNMADQIVLGQMAGSNAVASVGACATVVALVVNFLTGLGGGASVVLARAIGAGDEEYSKKIISSSMLAAVVLGVSASLIAIPLVGPLLDITKCPADCREGAEVYLTIYYASIPAITVYNFGAALLRASGDSRRPTVYLILAGALNVVMNVILCLVLTQKVAAVAIATLASQLLGAVLVTWRLFRIKEVYRLELSKLKFDNRIFLKILRYGIPSGFSSSLFAIANIQIQAGINSYGTDATTGNSACSSIEGMLAAICGGFNNTTLAMVGQNVGAEKPDRVKKAISLNLLYSALITGVCAIVVFIFKEPLLALYAPDSTAAVAYGVERTYYVEVIYAINAINGVLSSLLNAFGFSILVMCSSIVTTVVFRTVWMQLVYPHFASFGNIMLCFTVSWLMTLVILTTMSIIVYGRYRKGRLRKM